MSQGLRQSGAVDGESKAETAKSIGVSKTPNR